MQVLGHTGITLGVAILLSGVISRRLEHESRNGTRAPEIAEEVKNAGAKLRQPGLLTRYVDLRLLLLGSLLPDIIDKPVGIFLFPDFFGTGRIFSHTVLFLLIISLSGLLLYRNAGRTWLLVLAFGVLTHLIFDQMWLAPKTLFWPLYGLQFERIDTGEWAFNLLYALLTKPDIYLPELGGAAILFWSALTLVRRKRVFRFIKTGK